MLYNVYSVLNRNTKEWSLPMCIASESQALRIFYLQIQASEMMQKFPFDFELFEIGQFESDLNPTYYSDSAVYDNPLKSVNMDDGCLFITNVKGCLDWYETVQKKESEGHNV